MLTQVVPDLVFSEMRFLQKPESASKDESDPKLKEKSRKKKPRQASDKEISRYFDAGGSRPYNDGEDQKRHMPPHETAVAKKNLESVSPVVSDLLEKPFLGFGSRGTHPPTTSYYSWSESGREDSARAKHFAPLLEPLAAGQPQSSRARKQKEVIVLKPDAAQCSSAESAVTESHSNNQHVMPEHARDVNQATPEPAEPRPIQQADVKGKPILISDKHDTLIPTAASLANQSKARSNSTKKDSPVSEAVLNAPKVDENQVDRSVRSRPASGHVLKQHPEPWEELLQNCELAARPLVPTYYDDEGLARYSATVTQGQHTSATYDHSDLRLWRTDVVDFPEHDYLDNAALVSEHVGWTQPEAIVYQEDKAPFFEEVIEDDSDSLYSENGCGFPTENGARWDEGDAMQHDAVPDCRLQEGEVMDELAMFWQPNRLY